ncbi:MAG TPA: SOS response-associated peptidase [Nocardioides sp.]|jgi:putative SOS response-associated peptidase YedK
MCGRYASSRRPEDLIEEFEVTDPRVDTPLLPDYNVAPTKEVYAVMERPPRDDKTAPPARQLRVLRWGLVPSWAKDPSIGNRMINARMETVAEKPSYKRAFAVRRCLLPADGYFEWYPTEQKTKAGKPVKQPFFIHPTDGGVLAMAGLYEIWKDPTRDDDDPDRFRWTCTVLTTDAEDSLGRIHDRMPMMVPPERWAQWLDPSISGKDELMSLLEPAAPGRLSAYPVSSLVSNVRNNGPQLLEPLPIDDLPPDVRGDLTDGSLGTLPDTLPFDA